MNRLLRGMLFTGIGLVVVWLEGRHRARPYVEPFVRHTGRNLTFAGIAAATVRALEMPVVLPLARRTAERRWGLLARLPGPRWAKTLLGVLLLDYTLYLWHILTHRVGALWRFHLVHHVDLDLDATTGLRFHAGELTLSIPWRAAQIVLIGVGPDTLLAWQSLTLASVLFHHSNSRLPSEVERTLGLVLVTPRMHAIHHSIDPAQTDSNYSSGLAVWDRLHGTLRLDASAGEVTIGVAEFQDPIPLEAALRLPFTARASLQTPAAPDLPDASPRTHESSKPIS